MTLGACPLGFPTFLSAGGHAGKCTAEREMFSGIKWGAGENLSGRAEKKPQKEAFVLERFKKGFLLSSERELS